MVLEKSLVENDRGVNMIDSTDNAEKENATTASDKSRNVSDKQRDSPDKKPKKSNEIDLSLMSHKKALDEIEKIVFKDKHGSFRKEKDNSFRKEMNYPKLVLIVIGDSTSFVPKHWETSVLKTGITETVKGARGKRCIIDYFEAYLKAVGSGNFYRKPLNPDGQHCLRYGKAPLGVNKLNGLMRELCQKGGLIGNYTNHSGKRTCATAHYQSGVDEQEIMERTGHRSTTSVRAYRTSNGEIKKKLSDILNQ